LLQALTRAQDAAVQMIDTSMVRVHQHAACITDAQAPDASRGPRTGNPARRRSSPRLRKRSENCEKLLASTLAKL